MKKFLLYFNRVTGSIADITVKQVDFTCIQICVFCDTMHRASKIMVCSFTDLQMIIILSVTFDSMTICNLEFCMASV